MFTLNLCRDLLSTTHLWSAAQRRLAFMPPERVMLHCAALWRLQAHAAVRLATSRKQLQLPLSDSALHSTVTPVCSSVQVYWAGAEGTVDHEVLTHQQLRGLVTERFIRARWVDVKIRMLQDVRAQNPFLSRSTSPLPLSNRTGCCVRRTQLLAERSL